ncbi:MAG: hypothetical protein QXF19_06680 [Desulfurococcaceae archaeon]
MLRRLDRGEEAVDALISQLVDKPVLKLYLRSREIRVIYFKDFEWMDKSYLVLAERIGMLR